MLMMMPSLDVKSTLSIALEKSLVLAQFFVQQLSVHDNFFKSMKYLTFYHLA